MAPRPQASRAGLERVPPAVQPGVGRPARGRGHGWNEWTFRLFFLFGAILNVPFLALGTVYLLGGRRRGNACAIAVAPGGAFAAGVLVVAPLHAPVPVDQLPSGQEVFGALPRVLAAVASGGGAIVVIGGAAWSAWRFRRGPMLVANGLIALGTLVLSAGGLFNSVLDEMEAFAVTLVAGITVLFAGFLVATGARPRSPTRRRGAKHRNRLPRHRRLRRSRAQRPPQHLPDESLRKRLHEHDLGGALVARQAIGANSMSSSSSRWRPGSATT